MLKAALFDFGGVMTTSPFESFARYERENGLPAGFLRRVNSTNPSGNALARLERGELTVDQFGEQFLAESTALGHAVDGREMLQLLLGDVRPEMVTAVRACRSRLRTGLLTNNFTISESPLAGSANLFEEAMALFDVVVESSKVGHRKPERRFYEIACEQLQIAPSEAVFLDDLGTNLKVAREMGMTTIKVVDSAEAIAALEEVVGFPLSGRSDLSYRDMRT